MQSLVAFSALSCSPVWANAPPKLSDVYGFAAYLLSIDKPDDAAYILERLINANANARLRLSLANTYYRAGRTDEADKLVNELMVEAWRYPELVSSLRELKKRYALWNPDWSYGYQTLRTRNPNKRANPAPIISLAGS